MGSGIFLALAYLEGASIVPYGNSATNRAALRLSNSESSPLRYALELYGCRGPDRIFSIRAETQDQCSCLSDDTKIDFMAEGADRWRSDGRHGVFLRVNAGTAADHSHGCIGGGNGDGTGRNV